MPENVGGVGHAIILWCISVRICLSDKPEKPQRWSTDRVLLRYLFLVLRHSSLLLQGELCLFSQLQSRDKALTNTTVYRDIQCNYSVTIATIMYVLVRFDDADFSPRGFQTQRIVTEVMIADIGTLFVKITLMSRNRVIQKSQIREQILCGYVLKCKQLDFTGKTER